MDQIVTELRWLYATDRSAYLCEYDGILVRRYIAKCERIQNGSWSWTVYGFPSLYGNEPTRLLAMIAAQEGLKQGLADG